MKTTLQRKTIKTGKALWLLAHSLWAKKPLKWMLYSSILVFLCSYYWFFYSTTGLTNDKGELIDFEKMSKQEPMQASEVFAANGSRMDVFFLEIRDPVKYEDIPPLLVKAFLAAEDERFFEHSGIDFWSILRAVDQNIRANFGYGHRSGASTITQQLARYIYGDEIKSLGTMEQTYTRKIIEARIAIQLEKRYSKERIFEEWLNRTYFGHGANGLLEAIRTYYKDSDLANNISNTPKTVKKLRALATIVAMVKKPIDYCPIFHEFDRSRVPPDTTPEDLEELVKQHDKKEAIRIMRAKDRYNYVLGQMEDEDCITEQEKLAAAFPLDNFKSVENASITSIRKPEDRYFSRTVKEFLMSRGYSDDTLTKTGGLKIYTSQNPHYQNILSTAIKEHLARLNKELGEIPEEEKLQGYGVTLDVKTGKILAMTGGNEYGETQYNRIFARRSGGSAMKPFTYAAALEYAGMDIYDPVNNSPFRMRNSVTANGKVDWWAPKNFKERDPVPMGNNALYWVLDRSVNLATLQLAKKITLDSVFRMYRQVGLRGKRNRVVDPEGNVVFARIKTDDEEAEMGLEPYLPTVIGGSDVNLLELAAAYGPFARQGKYIAPSMITKITAHDGKILHEAKKPKPYQAMSERTANLMTIMLRAATYIGTTKITFRNARQQVACKTGTSDGPNDLLLVCFTPEIIVAIRIGYDVPKPISLPEYMFEASKDREMSESAGWVVGPLMRRIVNEIYQDREPVSFSQEIDDGLAGLLANHALSPRRGYIRIEPKLEITSTDDEVKEEATTEQQIIGTGAGDNSKIKVNYK
ncbi:MAG: transglycosylase domain-containing protein [bacterium]|nr:transglycosylase domain-containing protein [bacterium]